MRYLCVGEKYTNKQGDEKVAFKRIGELFTGKNGKEYAKIYHIPGILIHSFEKETAASGAAAAEAPDPNGPDQEVPF